LCKRFPVFGLTQFVEYSQRENNFSILAAFSFYIEDLSAMPIISPQKRPGRISIPEQDRLEPVPESPEVTTIPSISTVEINREYSKSPPLPPSDPILSNPRNDELLLKEVEDGPLFRSRIIALEKKTAALKAKTKKVITRGEALLEAQNAYFEADRRWYDSLQQLASTNSRAVQPLLTNYLDASFGGAQSYRRKKVAHLQFLINELRRIYDFDIKAAEQKKRAFEEESQDYYHSMTKYLSKNESEPSKQKEKDNKHQSRRKDYELKRFDYWSYMNDLNAGRKEQEILHHLTQYMDSQWNTTMEMMKSEQGLKPGLDALLHEVEEASREFKLMRTEREQRRRDLEIGKNMMGGENWQPQTDTTSNPSQTTTEATGDPSIEPVTPNAISNFTNRGQWLSDVEDDEKIESSKRKKEGILFALSRPANHNDPKVIPKLNWHKYLSRGP
jgi:Arf-GAP with SH3 domain, ANK repeat and PH domain-containing protein